MRLCGTRLRPVFACLAIMAAAALLALPAVTLAAPLGNPLNAVTESTPVSSFAKPAGYGNLTGADGDVSSVIWGLTTDLGYLGYMDGSNSTPIKMIDTGISGLTGVAYLGTDKWALAAGKTIYEGTVSGTTWHTDKTLLVTGLTSDLTDLDWALGAYLVSTGSDGIRKVLGDGTSTQTRNSLALALDVLAFQPNTYDNPLMHFSQNTTGFMNVDAAGVPFGSPKNPFWDNTFDITGLAFYQGGFSVVQALQVDIHNPEVFQQYMQPLPEPATVALIGLGGLAVAMRRRKAR